MFRQMTLGFCRGLLFFGLIGATCAFFAIKVSTADDPPVGGCIDEDCCWFCNSCDWDVEPGGDASTGEGVYCYNHPTQSVCSTSGASCEGCSGDCGETATPDDPFFPFSPGYSCVCD